MEMIIFVGAPGAGKSTFYHSRFRDTHIRINLDMLRTRHRESGLIDACLAFKQRMVIDNTNPTPAERAKYLLKARSAGFSAICYHFDAPIDALLARNAQRTGKSRVPDAAIRSILKKLEAPGREEGFDTVYQVVASDSGAFEIVDITNEIR